MSTAAEVEALEPAAFYDYFLEQGVRPNGRSAEACRPLSITLWPFKAKKAAGVALAVIGRTRVLGSATLQIGTPDLATPSDGDLVVKVSIAPFLVGSSDRQRSERVQLMSEHIREALLKSEALRLSDLCIEPYKSAWCLTLDLQCLDDDGGLFDASLAAATATLNATKLPVTTTDEKGVVRLSRAGQESSDLASTPLLRRNLASLTCRVWPGKKRAFPGLTESHDTANILTNGGGGSGSASSSSENNNSTRSSAVAIVADPDRNEESFLAASITVVYDARATVSASGDGDKSDELPGTVCAVFARGSVTPACLNRAIVLAATRAQIAGSALAKAIKANAASGTAATAKDPASLKARPATGVAAEQALSGSAHKKAKKNRKK